MEQKEKAPASVQGSESQVVSPDQERQPDLTTAMQLIQHLMVEQARLGKRLDALESENKRLKRQQAAAHDWSLEVPREMREVS